MTPDATTTEIAPLIATRDVLDLVRQGSTSFDIAEKLGIPRNQVIRLLKDLRTLVDEDTEALATEVFLSSHTRLNDLYGQMRGIVGNQLCDHADRIRAATVCVQIQKALTDLHKVGRGSDTTNVTANFANMTDLEIERALERVVSIAPLRPE